MKDSVTKQILKGLATGMAIAFVMSSPYGSRRLIKNIKHHLKLKREREDYLKKKFYYLRNKKLIEFKENGNEISILLTENGKKQVLKYDYDDMRIKCLNEWDDKWRLIIFDIPQTKKNARDALRLKLRDLGLVKFNDSVWVYPFECKNEIDFVAEVFNVGKYVHYVVTSSLTNSDNLRRIFKV